MRERLLCQHLPPPPPGVDAQPPAIDPALTTRERYGQHATDAACAGCHQLMDPIGFEHFDGTGRYRAEENELPIDAAGAIVSPGGGETSSTGVDGLAELLAGGADAHACFALQWVRFAYGVEENARLDCPPCIMGSPEALCFYN